MNNYGNSGVESRHALHGSNDRGPTQGWCQSGFKSRQSDATTVSRSSALPVPTLHGDQPDGAHIADSTLAGRHSYAREQSPPDADYFTRYNYADLAGGF